MITIGIDPGWATFGLAINQDGMLINKTSFKPKSFGTRLAFIQHLDQYLISNGHEAKLLWNTEFVVYMERFITYGGVQVDPEDILMLIGALEYYFIDQFDADVYLVKAIDWKIKICQHLVKTKGFSNPGKNLDKKFSLLAAEVLSGEKFKSDHEADAVCLSFLSTEIIKVNK